MATRAVRQFSSCRRNLVPATTTKKGRPSDTLNHAVDRIKKTLLDVPSDKSRLDALRKVVPASELAPEYDPLASPAHETISLAHALFKRHRRIAHEAELAHKKASLEAALEVLKKTDKTLYNSALNGDNKYSLDTSAQPKGLFPKEMRAPMEDGGSNLWDSKWKKYL